LDARGARGVNQVATRGREKSPEVADSKGAFFEGYPTRVFCKKRLDFIENEGVNVFEDDKEAVIG
jgi:hypothetical protein